MFSTLRNAWKVPDIRKKMIYTLMMLFIYRIGAHVPTPGVDVTYISEQVSGNMLGGFIDLFAGGALSNFSLFALGIMPYITASIIMNLLTMALPPLERLSKEGPEGRKKIASITRYAGVGLGLIQSIALLLTFGQRAILDTGTPMIINQITIVLCLTAGTALIMWIGEHITENGIGNGISLIIFAGIVARMPSAIINTMQLVKTGEIGIILIFLIMILMIAVVGFIVFMERGQRRIPVQYARRVVGRRMYGGQTTHLPLKVNSAGVIPPIFASSILMFPATIATFINVDWVRRATELISPGALIHEILYVIFIIFFCYFYTAVTFNPVDVAENMKKYGGYIPGLRPGKPTSDYIERILSRITLGGALYVSFVCVMPTVLVQRFNVPFYFGGTALLIVVGVAMDTVGQIESHMLTRHYEGFMKKRIGGRTRR